MNKLELTSNSPQETRRLGMRIGELAVAGDILLLTGKLGTGKTHLTQGIANGLGIGENTPSPSFVLVREFYGRLVLYHIDLYRLDNLDEIADLGLDDYLCSSGVCVIEWAEKGLSLMPPQHMLVKIDYAGEKRRRFCFEPQGERYIEMINKLKAVKI
jgi:tRNA threonylcarbamoyladenosine biosynthesis protein TsaE